MDKRLLLSISLCIASIGASAQVQFRDADLLRLGEMKMEKNATLKFSGNKAAAKSNKAEAIIRYDSQEALDEIREKGGEIISLVGTRTAIVRFDPKNAVSIAASKGVTGARLSTLVKRSNNKALTFSNIPDVHDGKGLPSPYKGKGVVVGLFDVGVDPNHINFRGADGTTRVSRVWEYAVPASAEADVYDTPAKISTFTSDTRQESHGTHVLGIMGGAFVDTYESNAPDYRGVAPEAELVIGCGDGYNVQILDALERIGKYAKEQGKPCVINLSFGDNLGPHDGSDEFTEAINDIAEKYDAVICLAGGNERDEPIAIVKELTESDPYVRTLTLKGTTDGDYQTFGSLEIWTEDGTPFEVSLDIISKTKPNDPEYSLVIPEGKAAYVQQGDIMKEYFNSSDLRKMNITTSGTPFQTYYASSFMGGVRGVDAYNKRYTAQLNMYLVSATAAYGNKYFTRLNIKGQPGKKIFVYCDGTYMSFGNRNMPGLEVPDGYGTNSNMACGPNTIAVGSYVTANVADSGYPDGTIGDLSYFSSYGETLDGRIMPDLCAPGQVIISSRNSYLPTSGSMVEYYPLEYSYYDISNKQTYYWTSCAGTSQASPHMAGIAALWRGADPQLSFADIRRIAKETAAAPGFSSEGWGSGKVDALAGIKSIVDGSSVAEILDNVSESIVIEELGGGVYNVYAPGETGLNASLYTLQGVAVLKTSTASDSLTLDASALCNGVYVLRVDGTHSTRTLKIRK